MKKIIVLIFIMTSCAFAFAQENTTISVSTMPPVVIKTDPVAGNKLVNPSLKELRITFSKEMQTNKMWSLVMISESTFPTISGKIKFDDNKKTCIIPVILKEGKNYALWINSKKYNSFRDLSNKSAVPYLLTFQTTTAKK